jgi:hypothetical protein
LSGNPGPWPRRRRPVFQVVCGCRQGTSSRVPIASFHAAGRLDPERRMPSVDGSPLPSRAARRQSVAWLASSVGQTGGPPNSVHGRIVVDFISLLIEY